MLWHWSSMKFTPDPGRCALASVISNMIRNNWNGSADPTIRSSSALYRELKSNAPNRPCRTSCITMNSMFVDCA